jgi:hypothetical protein
MLDGAVIFSLFYPNDSNTEAYRFVEDFKKEANGQVPDVFHALAYDGTRALLDAIERLDPEALKGDTSQIRARIQQELEKTAFEGKTGYISFDKDEHVSRRPCQVLSALNGELIPRESFGTVEKSSSHIPVNLDVVLAAIPGSAGILILLVSGIVNSLKWVKRIRGSNNIRAIGLWAARFAILIGSYIALAVLYAFQKKFPPEIALVLVALVFLGLGIVSIKFPAEGIVLGKKG